MRKSFYVLILLSYSLPALSQSNCNLKLDKDSIKVYTCEVKGTKFKAVRSTFTINTTLSSLAAAILDIDHCAEWQYKTLSASILKKVSDREIIYYTEIVAPVITSNRDFIIRLTINQNPQTREMTIDLVSIPDYIPAKKGIVRVPFSKARWTVKPLSHNKLMVDYYIEIDIGGIVPAWSVNLVAHQAPYETFKALKKVIPKYTGRTVSFIKN